MSKKLCKECEYKIKVGNKKYFQCSIKGGPMQIKEDTECTYPFGVCPKCGRNPFVSQNKYFKGIKLWNLECVRCGILIPGVHDKKDLWKTWTNFCIKFNENNSHNKKTN